MVAVLPGHHAAWLAPVLDHVSLRGRDSRKGVGVGVGLWDWVFLFVAMGLRFDVVLEGPGLDGHRRLG